MRDLSTRTKIYSLRIIKLFSSLPHSTEAQVLGKQLLRCGTKDGGLKELFFGDCTKRHVAFKGTRVERQSIKKEKLAGLLIHLQRCHTVWL